ncbi:methylated-DNA--[protein]-cysteine S-methyltransferase [Lichenihabitans sp. Uapishka_5]|uniref:methylated-DNA--[protein]-cysteine S-methyltransferase n=1 Tax=Lichenihabitans sp. Uapishka_5 TaxID=3037302 RepID=UPI0029E82A02|nr:methylated-DNA--[protein]-cysteine S-methyltransferase [Lichenihabitans sp. Uapishka_5]MDX7949777.1 methylated-DNA--[protein]-cysteine S-methyltransferase [Lichenihabitans sp. Uapishka_5]
MSSPVGRLTLVASAIGLRAVLWEDDRPGRVPLGPVADAPDHPVLRLAMDQLAAYFDGALQGFTVPLDPVGTPFQARVWAALGRIPFGTTRRYGAIAAEIGDPKAVRAVGAANGRNPISIIVPCHRVIGAAGALTGFAGGLAAKRWLLVHEAHGFDSDAASDRAQADLFGR